MTPPGRTQRLVLEVFRDTGATSARLREHLPAILPNTLYYGLSALKRCGYVTQGAKGDPFTITASGAALISQE